MTLQLLVKSGFQGLVDDGKVLGFSFIGFCFEQFVAGVENLLVRVQFECWLQDADGGRVSILDDECEKMRVRRIRQMFAVDNC